MRYELNIKYAEAEGRPFDENDEINIFYSITGLAGLIIVKCDYVYFHFSRGYNIIHLN